MYSQQLILPKHIQFTSGFILLMIFFKITKKKNIPESYLGVSKNRGGPPKSSI